PDLNLANPDVASEIDRIADFWLGDVGADGFRLDAAKHLVEDGATLENTPQTHQWLATFRDDVHATHPEALLLGEVFDSTPISSGYVTDGSPDTRFDFALAPARTS